ncbi:MAG: DeoR family transcriptional regulator [Treponema sp. GWB1_62_6]|nr:MAG: DeoR family transcriptional regulator [Treponema sp. GWA1_62_8]OHE66035.1 MAG: DeoR family transcriptional regulator [Treponema sp. GWB1_62_6]OHE68174.1 MAG: DeoR family transcriptional regulator [Treponema sp. GWC1_61_84]HCM28345.1 DeoR family transcriptional regulator [Treponema sp.]
MLTAQRKQLILDRLKSEGQVSVAILSREWEVSEDTVRRDLRDLAEEGLAQRVHGGALPASPAVGPYEKRESLSADVKGRLGKIGAGLVRPGQLVAIDGGTSNLQLVRSFPADLACTVVTHSPLIAAELRHHARVEILLIGGRIFRHSQVAVGSETAEAIGRLKTDIFFLGATGLRPDTGATTGDWEEAAVKRAFCRGAAETVLLVSPEKWGAASAYQIVPASELTTLVVDGATDDEALAPYLALGLAVVRA